MDKTSAALHSRLIALRAQVVQGICPFEWFALRAARLYISLGKGRRAIELLHTLQSSPHNHRQVPIIQTLSRMAHQSIKSRTEKTCALTMIVKNEEKNICRALDSVDDSMDEIVVCDTGSTDTTTDLIRLYGACVLRETWQNNFSTPRNVAIAHSSCDWIFWMDGDDELDKKSKQALVQLWRTAHVQGVAFCVANIQNGIAGNEFMQTRLFPRRRDICFERRIHEQVVFSLVRAGLPLSRCQAIRILHYGYHSPALQQAKAARNLPLIQAELVENPVDPALQASLGDCYAILSDYPNALAAYGAIIDKPESSILHPDVYVQAYINCARLYYKINNTIEAKRYWYRSLDLDKTRLESWYGIAHCLLREQKPVVALDCFFKCLAIDAPLRDTATDCAAIIRQSYYYAVDILLQQHCYRNARDLLDRALKRFPVVVEFYALMGDALLGLGNNPVAKLFFLRSIAMSPDTNLRAYAGLERVRRLVGNPPQAAESCYTAAIA